MHKKVEIKELTPDQSSILSELIISSPKEYTKHFTPFSFDENSLEIILSNAVNDKYFGIFINDNLVGFYMLRGFDEGFDIPSYGVWISKEFSRMGLSKLTLQHAITFCKANNIKNIMLKVHPDNLIAKNIYESFGFRQEGIDQKNSNLIYYKNLD